MDGTVKDPLTVAGIPARSSLTCVRAGAGYVLVVDVLTRGATFAALSSHIVDNGGAVSAVSALTVKQYSTKVAASNDLLSQVRERFQSVEDQFRAVTGY